jgi:acetyltransferase
VVAAGSTGAADHRKVVGAILTVRPYLLNWQRVLLLKDGSRVFVRPIRSEDAPKILSLLRSVSQEDLRLRFFDSIKEFSREFISKLTQLDYSRAMAFVASDDAEGDVVGVVRLYSDSAHETGEFAILLKSDRKGRGLGWALMQLIIEYARSDALKSISGQILQENSVMLNMSRELGFDVKVDPTERDIYNVTLLLAGSEWLNGDRTSGSTRR